jgi:hypothetical protein
MSNNKQSSVEWLIEQYKKCFGPVIPLIMNNENEKAKAMHKEEIMNAHFEGQCDETEGYPLEIAKEYYNETYGGDK